MDVFKACYSRSGYHLRCLRIYSVKGLGKIRAALTVINKYLMLRTCEHTRNLHKVHYREPMSR